MPVGTALIPCSPYSLQIRDSFAHCIIKTSPIWHLVDTDNSPNPIPWTQSMQPLAGAHRPNPGAAAASLVFLVAGLDGGDEQLQGCPLGVLVHVAAQLAAEGLPLGNEVLQPGFPRPLCTKI